MKAHHNNSKAPQVAGLVVARSRSLRLHDLQDLWSRVGQGKARGQAARLQLRLQPGKAKVDNLKKRKVSKPVKKM